MSRIIVWWRASSIALKIVLVGCGVSGVAALVVLLILLREPEQELVSGVVVTVVKTPNAPKDIVVVSQPTDFGGPQTGGTNALRGLVYFIPNGTSSLLPTGGMSPVAALYASRLDISPRSWRAGFPGVPGGRVEWFQIVYEGTFVTAHGGDHKFEILSDDGAKLFLDGRLVVENDGQHPPKSGFGGATLKPGAHRIRVEYYQGPRFEIALQLFVSPPGGARQILDASRVL